MDGVEETYHATPNMIEEENLLKGEVIESSPCTESVLLANEDDPPATGAIGGISAEETAAAVAAISNLNMSTEAEFLGEEVDVTMEESRESFEALSHKKPALQQIQEKKPPLPIDRSPKKSRGKHSNKGHKCQH